MKKLITLKEYSAKTGLSMPTIYKKIESGLVSTIKEGRSVLVEIEVEVEEESIQNDHFMDLLNEKIKYLEENLKMEKEAKEKAEQREKAALERAEADKRELYKQLEQANKQVEQSNILQMKTLESLNQLEYKTEKIEEELIKEKSKSWWQKLLNK